MANKFSLNHDIYKKPSLEKTISDYSQYCKVKTQSLDENNTTIEIFINPEHLQDAEQIKNEFLNYVLDLSIKTAFSTSRNN